MDDFIEELKVDKVEYIYILNDGYDNEKN